MAVFGLFEVLGFNAFCQPAPSPPAGWLTACRGGAERVQAPSPFVNVASALRENKSVTIFTIGANSNISHFSNEGGSYSIVERYLENNFKGIDVKIIDAGASGEMASDGGERIRTEAALTHVNLVVWQVGTADALARIPVDEFSANVTETLTWLKGHRIDVILVGLRYARAMSKDAHYQSIRAALRKVAEMQKVLLISRYEAEETLDRLKAERHEDRMVGMPETDIDYDCVADNVARAIASGLVMKGETPRAAR
jgi:hypothetical protein